MHDSVSQSRDLRPGDPGIGIFPFGRKLPHCLSDDLKVSNDGITGFFVDEKIAL